MKHPVILLVISLVFSCNINTDNGSAVTNLRVNSYTVECYGEMEGNCLLVQEGDKIGTEDWEYFYYEDSIEGFDYEAGYMYDLLVRKIQVKDPPQDGSSIQYKLIRVISKDRV